MINLEPDLKKLFDEGVKHEVPHLVAADRAIQVQQIRLLENIERGIVQILKHLQAKK